MMGYGAGLGFGFGGWLAVLGCILLVVGVVVLVAWLVGRGSHGMPAAAPRPAGSDAVEILRTRLARGEISRDEFLAAKQTLDEIR